MLYENDGDEEYKEMFRNMEVGSFLSKDPAKSINLDFTPKTLKESIPDSSLEQAIDQIVRFLKRSKTKIKNLGKLNNSFIKKNDDLRRLLCGLGLVDKKRLTMPQMMSGIEGEYTFTKKAQELYDAIHEEDPLELIAHMTYY